MPIYRGRTLENGGGGPGTPRNGTNPVPNPPPGGAAGSAQQNPSNQLAIFGPFMVLPGRRRSAPTRRKTSNGPGYKYAKKRPRTRSRKRSGKRAHLVKGSAAAKRFMAKLRRMQKRRR